MSIIALAADGDYHVVHPDQDCRGWPVDAAGGSLGRVEQFMIDTERDRVDSLRLSDGATVAIERVTLGAGVVYVGAADDVAALTRASQANVTGVVALPAVARRVPRSAGAVVPTPGADDPGVRTTLRGFASLDGEYRRHHALEYAALGRSYEEYLPAYQYGHGLAEGSTGGESWEAVEGRARAEWGEDNPQEAWESVCCAVREGWERAVNP